MQEIHHLPTFKSILKVITVSANGNTIFLQNGTYYTSKHSLTKNLVFDVQSRSGVSIPPNYNHLFNITNGKSLTLNNLRIMYGGNTANATIMLCSSSTLTVSNCQFDNCQGENGSTIRNTEPNTQITISNSSFINNRAFQLGDTIINRCNSATTSLTNCIFTTNKMTALVMVVILQLVAEQFTLVVNQLTQFLAVLSQVMEHLIVEQFIVQMETVIFFSQTMYSQLIMLITALRMVMVEVSWL